MSGPIQSVSQPTMYALRRAENLEERLDRLERGVRDDPMSDTPRTDAAYRAVLDGDCLPGCDSYAHEEMCPVCNGDRVMAEFARQLERELADIEAAHKKLLRAVDQDGIAVGVDGYYRNWRAEAAEAKLANINDAFRVDPDDAWAERFCAAVNWEPDGTESKIVEGQWHHVTFRELAKGYIKAALTAAPKEGA